MLRAARLFKIRTRHDARYATERVKLNKSHYRGSTIRTQTYTLFKGL